MKLALHGGKAIRKKPFPAWPIWDSDDATAILRVLESGKWGSIQGKEVERFEKEFAQFQGAEFASATNSGTAALEIALRSCGVMAGDEIILPAYTFVASATAVLANGAIPVFADIEANSYNIDATHAESLITRQTRAIMPVHFAGRPADMDSVLEVARRHHLQVIEDAAQAWGAAWRGKKVGSFGAAGGFSFQSSKNINAGEGGIITSNTPEIARAVASYINCGREKDGLWYAHYRLGSNNRMTEFQGALLQTQIKRFTEQHALRQQSMAALDRGLADIPGISPLSPDDRITVHAGHLYIFRYDSEAFDGAPKARFIDALRAEGIPCSGGYTLPLYAQPLFQKRAFGPFSKMLGEQVDYSGVRLPVTERACRSEAIWLSQNLLLDGPKGMKSVIDAISKLYEHRAELNKETDA